MLNIFTLPLVIKSYIESNKNNINVNNKLLLFSALINSIMINSVICGIISFFTLKKCIKEGLITGLNTTSIIMISFILFPITISLFSTIMVAILYKARESCEEKHKDLFITFDIHFTNPATGLIMAITALVGTAQDILEKRKNQQDTHSYEYSYEYYR